MGIDIRIKLDLTPRQKRLIKAGLVVGAVIGGLGVGLAVAAPHQWKASDPLTASDLNSIAVATGPDGGRYSGGATKYCGIGATSTNGAPSYGGKAGYPATKALCEASTACGNSATAHMCSTEEVIRSASMGINMPSGWYSVGVYVVQSSYPDLYRDCTGWTSLQSTALGTVWGNSPDAPTNQSCNVVAPVLCCD